MRVLFLTNDLVFPSRVAGVVQRLGGRLETAGNAQSLMEKIESAAAEPAVVVIDLNTPGAAAETLVPKLNSLRHPPRTIVAFGPHVHEAKLEAARGAGCDIVLTRGQFDAQMDALLEKLLLGERE